jgi:hypothetical protein
MALQETDQGLLNGNPNFIAVPTKNINLVPTDIRGLTFSRTPQQVGQRGTAGLYAPCRCHSCITHQDHTPVFWLLHDRHGLQLQWHPVFTHCVTK